MKDHEKLHRISKSNTEFRKKIDPFKAKKSYGGSKVEFGTFLQPKNEKFACKTQYRLARISIFGSYDSSEVKSSDDANKLPPMRALSEMRGKYCFVFEAQFLGGHGP